MEKEEKSKVPQEGPQRGNRPAQLIFVVMAAFGSDSGDKPVSMSLGAYADAGEAAAALEAFRKAYEDTDASIYAQETVLHL